jgi:hypothetical protein
MFRVITSPKVCRIRLAPATWGSIPQVIACLSSRRSSDLSPQVGAGDLYLYANLTDKSEVVEIDAKTALVTRRWSTAPCKQPVPMAIDTVHHRLFSGCRSGVMAVSDYETGEVVATVPIGKGVDGAGYDASVTFPSPAETPYSGCRQAADF